MATDKSDPRVALIFQVGILAIVGLLGARAFLQAYFDRMERGEAARKLGTYDSLVSMRADAKEHLSSGAMPIDKAMQMLATKGRMNASPDIMPSASKDVAPLQGWSKMPSDVPPAMTAPPPPPPEPPPATSASASASAVPSAAPAGSQKPRQP
jgi:hypothetical protein